MPMETSILPAARSARNSSRWTVDMSSGTLQEMG
eukprot:CAMPEP_0198545646 /NCGR_PEP_ID=MMETSP1462-20131121/64765_1 /TAXON_ID=1333877 /ORGANISM="Brandtodinium nutriculum, Strain RCC3387" /LENGTH=33 /DNA_ID= /DNA_START= /DNA_END= /DNA_ORIENTATION=